MAKLEVGKNQIFVVCIEKNLSSRKFSEKIMEKVKDYLTALARNFPIIPFISVVCVRKQNLNENSLMLVYF